MNKNLLSYIKKITKLIGVFAIAFIMLTQLGSENVKAAKPLDEILLYSITADVKENATVDLTYDISWKVLDSSSEGPLEWVQVGLPNSHINDITALSDTISKVNTKTSGGTYAVIYFDRKYYKDEVVNFSYKVNMDYMYQVYPEEGVAEYTFTPGWFDGINVDMMMLRWNSDKVDKFEPTGCLMDGGYHTFTTPLKPGEKFTIEMSYPLDAYGFNLSMHEEKNDDDDYKYSEHNIFENALFTVFIILACIIIVAICAAPMLIPIMFVYGIYKAASGFTLNKDKKITRTIIEYYPACPNCGGSREEGAEKCSYCGSNMVKSKQIVKEEDLKNDDKRILDFKTDGEYRYSSNPNRYVRVNVISIPRVTYSRPTGGFGGGSSHHSSCAHSSCACACACACAGGGRAGCSTKDFYNTDFKLSYLTKFKKRK